MYKPSFRFPDLKILSPFDYEYHAINMNSRILIGDALAKLRTLPSDTVDCVVTSPPYFGLRSYLKANDKNKDKEIGLESSVDEYIAKMVAIFGEVRRVLKPSGVVWLNLGDAYAGSGKGQTKTGCADPKQPALHGMKLETNQKTNLKNKDLIGLPWRVALALQEDGWWLRSDIIWSKKNCMPSSVSDRCTSSHEHIFMLTKDSTYFFDNMAIKERATTPAGKTCGKNSAANVDRVPKKHLKQDAIGRGDYTGFNDRWDETGGDGLRNPRDVWNLATRASAIKHYAQFPPDIPLRCIRASTSECGNCVSCGAPYKRKVDKKFYGDMKGKERSRDLEEGRNTQKKFIKNMKEYTPPKTVGWEPTCECNTVVMPAVVLDPFCGSGTTLAVAKILGRKYIGIDIDKQSKVTFKQRLKEISERRAWLTPTIV